MNVIKDQLRHDLMILPRVMNVMNDELSHDCVILPWAMNVIKDQLRHDLMILPWVMIVMNDELSHDRMILPWAMNVMKDELSHELMILPCIERLTWSAGYKPHVGLHLEVVIQAMTQYHYHHVSLSCYCSPYLKQPGNYQCMVMLESISKHITLAN